MLISYKKIVGCKYSGKTVKLLDEIEKLEEDVDIVLISIVPKSLDKDTIKLIHNNLNGILKNNHYNHTILHGISTSLITQNCVNSKRNGLSSLSNYRYGTKKLKLNNTRLVFMIDDLDLYKNINFDYDRIADEIFATIIPKENIKRYKSIDIIYTITNNNDTLDRLNSIPIVTQCMSPIQNISDRYPTINE